MRGSLVIGRIFGIPVGIHSSWLIVIVLITWTLASGYFPHEYPGWPVATYWAVGFITSIFFFASVLVHELAHSLVARREGTEVSGITLFIFGGVSMLRGEPRSAGQEFRIAIVGPLTSLALGLGFRGLGSTAAGSSVAIAAACSYLGRINILLAVFNLLPGFPLDGGRVFRAIIWGATDSFQKATRWASFAGRAVAFFFIFWGLSQIFAGHLLNGLWIAFIGWFLSNAADSSYQQIQLRDMLAGVRARDVMTQDCLKVPESLRLDQLVHDYILGTGRRCFLVGNDGAISGLVTVHNVRTTPRELWAQTTAGNIMTPISKVQSARPDEEITALLERMQEADVNQLPVIEDGELKGLVSRDHLLSYIRTRTELGA